MTSNPFQFTTPQIAASILSANFARLADEIADVDRGGADFLHLDVMDGHFVPNITFGPAVTRDVRKVTRAFLDVHLMITDPEKYAPLFVQAGADAVTFHVEVVPDPAATAKKLRDAGCKHVGITLNPATPIESIFPAIEVVDHVLIMSVVPGFGGQKFMPDMLAKVKTIRPRLKQTQRIEIDGGIHEQTIRQAFDAGVNWFVIGSGIFDQKDRVAAITGLRKQLSGG
jgi:ribulose-phosphate 3-epimerase